MAEVHYLHDEIVVVGWACRFPGAGSIAALWSLLIEGRCAVSQVPPDRFSLARYGHPRRRERGKSYTWAAGVLDDIWGFDPAVFGISPREAEQMDPQQRILLQLTWEALEDAGVRPSSIAGKDVGVFVGASQTDYAHAIYGDQAIADSHFATGNALAILANRISYIYDLRGPSITVDTACSSSLVALHQAVEALRSGRIETAIVGGINVIGSPAEFISFSQASMLSPTGLCRAFSADADGYVRAEGAAVLVLRRGADIAGNPVHGIIVASDVNSDGRTSGISLPSIDGQEALLRRVYARTGIDAERLAFVEAHGTGTPVGDPIEAQALGRSLGGARTEPLPIGSIKSNIGHVEAASGLAGLLKALLALNHGFLPQSLHIENPNPAINFDDLNLALCQKPLLLPNAGQNYAGVNSFGFGGTNAHVVVARGRKATRRARPPKSDLLALSAASKPALIALSQKYLEHIAHWSDVETAALANTVAYRRERLGTGLAISSSRHADVTEALHAFIAGAEHPELSWGTAAGKDLPAAFVYSGNGSQWPGMGIAAYRHNQTFRAHFDNLDGYFCDLAGWSLKEALMSERLDERLPFTRVAQPLIFAIQSATTAALCARGIEPAAVLGHSVGEVAAAEAAGILDLRTAVEVIYFRSTYQELVRGHGRMAALLAPPDAVEELIEYVGGIEVAAFNSPQATTVSGSTEVMALLKKVARTRSIPALDLDLDYPFHTALMAPVEAPLSASLKHLAPVDGAVPFISTVTGSAMAGERLGAGHWWHNVRRPVQFVDGIRAAAKTGARYFIEIGPRSTLLKHIADTLTEEGVSFAGLSVLERNEPDHDPIKRAVAKALLDGAKFDASVIFGPDSGASPGLPHYPWQQENYRYTPTLEAIGVVEAERRPFSGARYSRDALEWHAHIDTALFPELADHKVGEQTIFPGAGFLEIVFSVAREWSQLKHVAIADFEILKPLDLTNGETREIMSRVSPVSCTIEIFSRPRLSQANWLLHCRGRILESDLHASVPTLSAHNNENVVSGEDIYRLGDVCGLHYGPAFRLLSGARKVGDRLIRAELTPSVARGGFVLDPMHIDACGHALLLVFDELHAGERGVSYLPVRLDEAALFVPGACPRSAVIEIVSRDDRAIVANYSYLGANGELIAVLRGVRCQAVQVRRSEVLEANAFVELPQTIDGTIVGATGVPITARALIAHARARRLLLQSRRSLNAEEELLEGLATVAAFQIASALADRSVIDVAALIRSGRLPNECRTWLTTLLGYLAAAGLASPKKGRWVLIDAAPLPDAGSLLTELTQKHPRRAAETLLAGALGGLVVEIAAKRAVIAPQARLSRAILDFYDLAGSELSNACGLIERLIESAVLWPPQRSLRILQVGFGPLSQLLVALRQRRDFTLSILETSPRRRDLAERQLFGGDTALLIDAQGVMARGPYDLIVAVESLHRLPASIDPACLHDALAPRGLLLALEPKSSLFRDIIFGLDPNWLSPAAFDHPVGRIKTARDWQTALEHVGFANVQAHAVAFDAGRASLLVAERKSELLSRTKEPPHSPPQTILIHNGATVGQHAAFGTMLDDLLRQNGINSSVIGSLEFSEPAPGMFVHIGGDDDISADVVAALTARCLDIKACAERFGSSRAILWLVFRGALCSDHSSIRPVAAGAWTFSRTLANEFPQLDVRRVDITPHTPDQVAIARLHDIIASGTAETELQIDAETLRAVRADTITRTLDRVRDAQGAPSAAKLQRRLPPGQRLQWEASERVAPGPHEVEIAVEASGLNFRDVMWSMSLLPDEIIEGGIAGATLGCECAGRVIRRGSNVRHLRLGDRVTAFAASAFATHVTVPAAQAAKLPPRISCEAGATIPVAFLTAYYSLIIKAKLARGEWILIHGGAGGVGLAAIQVARTKGARIIATAGSQAKRDLLRALGVPHVIDSRSTMLTDEVRAIVAGGVDVVLNSLAGEAMERSLACLRPFGRFVELGKRDYVSNTPVGLRPFRNNLSYFGVDIDQILLGHEQLGRKLYGELMRMFASGRLAPLPYSVFRACDVVQAFELVQRSEHIGKIVVQPPPLESVRRNTAAFQVNTHGTHIITGGFGGFGLEAAKWLVERGACHLVLIGRHGARSDEAKKVLAGLAAQKVNVREVACDVADPQALGNLFEEISVTMPPIVGILHAAMVLDDGLLANLDAKRFHQVLAPKVKGAENLDLLTSGMALDYFVLFSSATTLMGSPGQGNYVAANAYMEALARRRRYKGLKALAIGWGPIIDVGVLANSERLRSRFQKLTGVRGMRARDALDLMAQALALPSTPELAVMTISQTEGLFKADRLAVLNSPTYMRLAARGQKDTAMAAGVMDLQAIARNEGLDGLRLRLSDVIVTGVARVLRAREEEISRVRPLSDMGLDSLMALEFAMNLEDRFGIHVALTSAIGDLTVGNLANEIMAQINLDDGPASAMVRTVADHHVKKAAPQELAIIEEIVGDQTSGSDAKGRRVLS